MSFAARLFLSFDTTTILHQNWHATHAASQFAIEGLTLAVSPILLEDNIIIRQITEDELWDLGDIDKKNQHFYSSNPFTYLDDSWKILEIKLQHDRKSPFHQPYGILDVVLAALRLESFGSFRIIDLGTEGNFFFPRQFSFGSLNGLRFTRGHAGTYALDKGQIQHLRDSWPDIRKIMESDKHYLRRPAQRLLEGGFRDRPEDAVLDYSIGLEILLLAGLNDELSYRFALRGATVLSWETGHKKPFFDNLKNFYKLRSSIVHGSAEIKFPEHEDDRPLGDDYLRKIWWWFFNNGFSKAIEGTKKNR